MLNEGIQYLFSEELDWICSGSNHMVRIILFEIFIISIYLEFKKFSIEERGIILSLFALSLMISSFPYQYLRQFKIPGPLIHISNK